MIKFTSENEKVFCDAEVRGFGVYLDTWALIDLANGSESRRHQVVDSIRQGGTLLFSWANAMEIGALSGASSDAIRIFLQSIGPHWFPLELNPWKVVKKENAGLLESAAISEHFMKAYVEERISDLSTNGDNLLNLSGAFFDLSTVLNWLQESRERIKTDKEKLDQALKNHIKQARDDYDKDPNSFNYEYPEISYDPRLPATFVLNNLMRMLVREAKAFSFKKGDGLDFSHAVLAAAFGSMVTLDKQWQRRIRELPQSNHLAKVFYRNELDQFVKVLKECLDLRNALKG
ncbi:MAG: hypothetical protein OEY80_08930 [Nitrospirota bacterium]|nr:hypothetical protein [Nitrospirota bacterium]